jgi:hypothetical protein
MVRVQIWENRQRVACGFSWLLRVIDHEAVLLDPNLFSSLVHRSVVSGAVETKAWTADKQPAAGAWLFSLKHDRAVQVASNSAPRDKDHTGALYSKSSDLAVGAGMSLFTTTYGVKSLRRCAVCCGLWSDELRGPITHGTWNMKHTA